MCIITCFSYLLRSLSGVGIFVQANDFIFCTPRVYHIDVFMHTF